jgi:hypothetical protein
MSSRIAFFNPDNPPLNTSNGTGIITLNDTMDAYEYLTIFYQTGLFLYLGISQVGELNDAFFNPNDPKFNEQWYLKQTSNRDIDAEKAWTNFSSVGSVETQTNHMHQYVLAYCKQGSPDATGKNKFL